MLRVEQAEKVAKVLDLYTKLWQYEVKFLLVCS